MNTFNFFVRCPAKCGNYLIDIDQEFLQPGVIVMKQGECPCGAIVCCNCHKLYEEGHSCPKTEDGK